MKIHEKLRGLREDHDLSQSDYGKFFNMGQKKISRIENGTQAITTDELKAFCQFWNVSADWLLGLPDGLPYPKRK